MFIPGQRVICVKAPFFTPGLGYGDEELPVLDRKYTIRNVRDSVVERALHPYMVWLNEIVNRPRIYLLRDSGDTGMDEIWFGSGYFRPLTDISVFTAMLNEAPILEDA